MCKSTLHLYKTGISDIKEITRLNHVGPEPVAIMEHPSGININLILNASPSTTNNILMDIPEKHSGYTHIALEVTDLNSVETLLKQKGVTITEGPITIHNGSMHMFTRDPDGNVIEFHKPAA